MSNKKTILKKNQYQKILITNIVNQGFVKNKVSTDVDHNIFKQESATSFININQSQLIFK